VSPAVGDGTVYAGSYDGEMRAVAPGDGTVQWSEYIGPAYSSPAVVGDTVCVAADDGISALSADDGTSDWVFETQRRVTEPVAVVDGVVYGGDGISTSGGGTVYAVAADDGSELWRFDTDGPAGGPAVIDGTAYVGDAGGNMYALTET